MSDPKPAEPLTDERLAEMIEWFYWDHPEVNVALRELQQRRQAEYIAWPRCQGKLRRLAPSVKP